MLQGIWKKLLPDINLNNMYFLGGIIIGYLLGRFGVKALINIYKKEKEEVTDAFKQ